MKDYTIYLAPDCHECDKLQKYIKDNNLNIATQLLTKEAWLEKGMFVFPSLIKNDEVIAYGNDIIKHLK